MSEVTHQIMTIETLRARRNEILRLAEQHGAFNVRIFGSVARGEATPQSDVDVIATFHVGTSIFEVVGLWQDLQDLLGCDVDVIADHPDGGHVMQAALCEAVAL